MKIKIIVLSILIFPSLFLKSQDYHFSQYSDIPILVNPALTGVFPGNQRFVGFYRNQWSSISHPFETFGFTFDSKIWQAKARSNSLSMGLSVVRDKAGATELSLTQAMLSISYDLQISYTSSVTGGVQAGMTQMGIKEANFLWHNQYDANAGVIDPTIPSGESKRYEGYMYNNLAAGIVYSYYSPKTNVSSSDGVRFHMGAAYHHFNSPENSFTGLHNHTLHPRLTLNAKSDIGLQNSSTVLKTSLLYQMQGPNQEVLAGVGFRLVIQEQARHTGFVKESAITLGCLMRINDAVIPYVGIEFSNFAFGISYDANLGSLGKVTNSVGGLELNFRFINPNPFRNTPRRASY